MRMKYRVLLYGSILAILLSGCGTGKTAEVSAVSVMTEGSGTVSAAAGSAEEEPAAAEEQDAPVQTGSSEILTAEADLADGVYTASVDMTGGTGKAYIESPCEITVKDGQATAAITWSSSHYDFMIVQDETFYPVNTEGPSQFLIPVVLNEDMPVQADTTAMSQPHLIDYTLRFTLEGSGSGKEEQPDAAGKPQEEEAAESRSAETDENEEAVTEPGQAEDAAASGFVPPEIAGLTYVSEMEKDYAEDFAVFYYEDGYKVLTAESGRTYLLVPEGAGIPDELPRGMVVLQAPLDHVYLAASSAMALFHAMDALPAIAFSGTEADGWYIEDAAEAMRSGDIQFAGKYSQPDYEGLLAGGCDVAVESTMILHTPEVQEKLETLGIPVLIDESSHESHPLGRTEWIRFYGALLDKEEEADAFFASQKEIVTELEGVESTEKTVAYFFVNSNGSIVVRKSDDYIPAMIALAGGKYVFSDLQSENPESSSGSVTLSMEEFYARAGDCDYLIYNAAIENPLRSLEDLADKNPVFADFKAVKEGHVYTTDKYMYQATDIMGELIRDIHKMLTGEDDSAMLFLRRVS